MDTDSHDDDRQHAQSTPQRSWLRRMLNRAEVDRAVFYAVSARAWQFLAGPVTLLLIVTYFSEDTQGFYYTFWSLLALQTFVELGYTTVIIHLASHEWSTLQFEADGTLSGDARALSRLVSLARMTLRWFGVPVSRGAYVGVWSINDDGDVPPRWKVAEPGVLKQPRGVALDPEAKTVIVSDKYLNAILTYSLPEMFE